MANPAGRGRGGQNARAKCVAVFFMLLLGGHEVRAVRDTALESFMEGDLELGAAGAKLALASAGAAVSALFASATERAARVDAVSAHIRNLMHGKGQPKLCNTISWAEERQKFQSHVEKINRHAASIREHIAKEHVVATKWGSNEANLMLNELKALDPCLKAEKSGTIRGTAVDPELAEDFAKGPDREPTTDPGTYLQRTYVVGVAAARYAMMHTKLMDTYRADSGCKLGMGVKNRIFDEGFRAKPMCYNKCNLTAFNVDSFSEEVQAKIGSCAAPKSDPIYAPGSFKWTTCGGWGYGTTTRCTVGNGYHVCCCKSGRLNGNYNDIEQGRGCIKTCTKEDAQLQRALQHRVQMVVDEYNGKYCDYGHTISFYHFASNIRNSLEKMYYERAMGHRLSVDEMEQNEEELVKDQADSFVQLEEAQGSLMELDSEDASQILDIICFVVICMIVIMLCLLAPDLCIFIAIWSIIMG